MINFKHVSLICKKIEYDKAKIINGSTKQSVVKNFEDAIYLIDASENTKIKKVIRKIKKLYFLKLTEFLF